MNSARLKIAVFETTTKHASSLASAVLALALPVHSRILGSVGLFVLGVAFVDSGVFSAFDSGSGSIRAELPGDQVATIVSQPGAL